MKRKREDAELGDDTDEIGINDLPIELVEMVFWYLPIWDAVLSASLVCKAWHRLLNDGCDNLLWSIYFQRDIVELKNALPYYNELEGQIETQDRPWKQRCVEACSEAKNSEFGQDWILNHGYKRIKGTEPRRVSTLLDLMGSESSYNNIVINRLRCLVALGHSLHGSTTHRFWREGGFLHWSASMANHTILQFLCSEFASPSPEKVNLDHRLDVNEQCSSDGFTPLHCLFEGTDKPASVVMQSVMLLLNCGADPKIENQAGQDAMQFATLNGFQECASAMIPFIKSTPEGSSGADERVANEDEEAENSKSEGD